MTGQSNALSSITKVLPLHIFAEYPYWGVRINLIMEIRFNKMNHSNETKSDTDQEFQNVCFSKLLYLNPNSANEWIAVLYKSELTSSLFSLTSWGHWRYFGILPCTFDFNVSKVKIVNLLRCRFIIELFFGILHTTCDDSVMHGRFPVLHQVVTNDL